MTVKTYLQDRANKPGGGSIVSLGGVGISHSRPWHRNQKALWPLAISRSAGSSMFLPQLMRRAGAFIFPGGPTPSGGTLTM